MKKLPSVAALRSRFPPKTPEMVSGDPSDQWYFMLGDGTLIGVELVNHFDMMEALLGKIPTDQDSKMRLLRLFHRKYGAIRVGFHTRSRLSVQLFGPPTQAQRTSIATLVKRTECQQIAWDFDEDWSKSGDDQSIGDFLRAVDAYYGGI
jgi:hypothetical protein